jgi:hypothetical protein
LFKQYSKEKAKMKEMGLSHCVLSFSMSLCKPVQATSTSLFRQRPQACSGNLHKLVQAPKQGEMQLGSFMQFRALAAVFPLYALVQA